VTFGRGGREPGGRRSFPGAARDDRRLVGAPEPREQGAAPLVGAEIEELPAQPVLGRGRPRPTVTTALAAGIVVLIMAAGFGFLGGRSSSSPTRSAVAQASGTPGAEPSAEPPAPIVTPAMECLPLVAGELPEVRLSVPSAGGIHRGSVDVLRWNQPGPQPTPQVDRSEPQPTAAEPLAIRADVIADLQTTGNPCASAWAIELLSQEGAIELEQFASPDDEPGYALQNQFELLLAPYRGQAYDLSATLTFPGVITRTTWPIAVVPFEMPTAQLTTGKRELDVKPGCNVYLTLGNGYSEAMNPCSTDVVELPRLARLLVPGPPLILRFPRNWYISRASIACGHFEDLVFRGDATGTCEPFANPDGVSLSIDRPGAEGVWTLAIETCATQLLSDVTNEACGTWYTTIETATEPK
jgi:hypothetical protein